MTHSASSQAPIRRASRFTLRAHGKLDGVHNTVTRWLEDNGELGAVGRAAIHAYFAFTNMRYYEAALPLPTNNISARCKPYMVESVKPVAGPELRGDRDGASAIQPATTADNSDDCGSISRDSSARQSSASSSDGLSSRTSSRHSLFSCATDTCDDHELCSASLQPPLTTNDAAVPNPSYSAASIIPPELMARICASRPDVSVPTTAPASVKFLFEDFSEQHTESRNRQRLAVSHALQAYVQPHIRAEGFEAAVVAASVAHQDQQHQQERQQRQQLAGMSRRSLLTEALAQASAKEARVH